MIADSVLIDRGVIIVAVASSFIAAGAFAMNSPLKHTVECRVVDAQKLPHDTGGEEAFCAAIRRSAVAMAVTQSFKVEARVSKQSIMTATLTTADGTQLPEQEYGISDRGFDIGSLQRFADNLVSMVARSTSNSTKGS